MSNLFVPPLSPASDRPDGQLGQRASMDYLAKFPEPTRIKLGVVEGREIKAKCANCLTEKELVGFRHNGDERPIQKLLGFGSFIPYFLCDECFNKEYEEMTYKVNTTGILTFKDGKNE